MISDDRLRALECAVELTKGDEAYRRSPETVVAVANLFLSFLNGLGEANYRLADQPPISPCSADMQPGLATDPQAESSGEASRHA